MAENSILLAWPVGCSDAGGVAMGMAVGLSGH